MARSVHWGGELEGVSSIDELKAEKPPAESVYTYETWGKAARVAYLIFSIIFVPLGLWRLIHYAIGKLVVPSTKGKKISDIRRAVADRLHQSELRVKRIPILVDGNCVDALMVGTSWTTGNHKWMLFSNGNDMHYETALQLVPPEQLAQRMNVVGANYLFYNYQGAGASEGSASRHSLIATQRAMLRFLEEKAKATHICQESWSLGGVVTGEVMKSHQLQKGVQYGTARYKSLASTVRTVYHSPDNNPKFGGCCRFLVRIIAAIAAGLLALFGWQMESLSSAQQREQRRWSLDLIGQESDRIDPTLPDHIKSDGVIAAKASLAYHLLPQKANDRRLFGGWDGGHMGIRPLIQGATGPLYYFFAAAPAA